MKSKDNVLLSLESKIHSIRGHKVLLDFDLAELSQIPTMRLNQQVRRNLFRFPPDFMFSLTKQEVVNLKSQFVISSWGGRRTLPLAFTEQGVAMLSSVLNSRTAIEVNIVIMRTFVQMRRVFLTHREFSEKLKDLEDKCLSDDKALTIVFDALRELMQPQSAPTKRIAG